MLFYVIFEKNLHSVKIKRTTHDGNYLKSSVHYPHLLRNELLKGRWNLPIKFLFFSNRRRKQ
jgi:hypothetical protein